MNCPAIIFRAQLWRNGRLLRAFSCWVSRGISLGLSGSVFLYPPLDWLQILDRPSTPRRTSTDPPFPSDRAFAFCFATPHHFLTSHVSWSGLSAMISSLDFSLKWNVGLFPVQPVSSRTPVCSMVRVF